MLIMDCGWTIVWRDDWKWSLSDTIGLKSWGFVIYYKITYLHMKYAMKMEQNKAIVFLL